MTCCMKQIVAAISVTYDEADGKAEIGMETSIIEDTDDDDAAEAGRGKRQKT